ncbi:zinc transporter ZIP4 [Mycteria americana]|uniref:zinc transporter ZIP4 n=1 Tax=Mycteria americana TaxID=33587 RepID=UPI003F584F7A
MGTHPRGDALLHLLPQVLGVHGHGEGTPGHEPPGHGEGAPEQPWKVLGVLGGLFAFFLLEKLLGILLPHREEVKVEDTDLTQSTQELQSQGRLPLPSLLALGRAAHALTDGLALGAAFATSGSAGLGAGLALLCHELPHALGAAAVLERAGRGRALALAAAGAVPVLPGLYAGIALGGAAPARAWMGAPAAGLLLHLGLCHAVPAMLAARDGHPWVLLGLQSAGLLGGWGVLLLLALYEDKLLR